jgi:methylenetetrahydrofolate--tRNA-(uracil-5-)-methyltransferase
MIPAVTVIGGGLAGTEAAWQLATRGIPVRLQEMRPVRRTPAHQTDRLAELVCSNSMGSLLPDRALGMLKYEMRRLGSLVIETALMHAIPAGQALAVSRDDFSADLTERTAAHPLIEIVRQEATTVPDGPAVVATGPLTSDALAGALVELTGSSQLYFYDAMAPIVEAGSIDLSVVFRAGRWERDEDDTGDYLNCPFDKPQYERFLDALLAAPRTELQGFEKELERYFEGCMPVEVLASRGRDALRFGPMRPVGLRDPRTGRRPWAVVQLRQDNVAASLYNLVGFQTNLRWGAQEEVLRLIPGLEQARWVRLGQMHRNTFICSPLCLDPTLQFRTRGDLFFAGQVTGTEGYVGSTLGGLVAGINMARHLSGIPLLTLPRTTMAGALLHYVTHADPRDFQPMKANMALLPELETAIRPRRERAAARAARGARDLETCLDDIGWDGTAAPGRGEEHDAGRAESG